MKKCVVIETIDIAAEIDTCYNKVLMWLNGLHELNLIVRIKNELTQMMHDKIIHL